MCNSFVTVFGGAFDSFSVGTTLKADVGIDGTGSLVVSSGATSLCHPGMFAISGVVFSSGKCVGRAVSTGHAVRSLFNATRIN